MKLIETASQKRVHPKTLACLPCMKYQFSTGHSMIVWADGFKWYHNKNGNALNPKSGAKLIEKMNILAA